MLPLIYRCPRTGISVQALVAADLIGATTMHVPLDCPLCSRTHLVNLAECTTDRDRGEP